MIDGGDLLIPKPGTEPTPKIGTSWQEDAAGAGVFGMIGGVAVVAGGTVALPAILGAAAVGAGAYASVVGVKRLYYWVTDR